MSPPEAVVFDVGNVLVDWEPMRLYRRRIPDPQARAALFARVDFDAMNLAGDVNGDLAAEVRALAARHPGDAAHILAWREEWEVMIGPEFGGVCDLLRGLKAAGVPVYGLTNFAADTWELALEMFPALREFDDVVVSGREKVAKPDPRIFALLEAAAGRSGPALFFADDRPANVAAARARGWRAHLHEDGDAGADALRAALRAEGLAV